MTDARLLLRSIALGALGACVDAAPAAPSFQDDVMPILAANCVRCHGYPAIGGAPGDGACSEGADGVRWCGIRYDSYDDVIVDEGDPADPSDDVGVRGVARVAAIIPARVNDPRDPMPPRFPLREVERETLVRWAEGDPPARAPRPGNRAPVIAITEVGRTGTVVTLRVVLDDDDGDLVVGGLRAIGGSADVLVAPIQTGRDEVTWDTARVAAGTYRLVARVDDGGGRVELDAGTLIVGAP